MSLHKDLLEKLATLITTAFGLVAALAWNSAIQGFFERHVAPRFGEGSQLQAMFLYALAVTILAVLATVWIGRTLAKAADLRFPGGWTQAFRGQEPPPPT